MTESLKVARTTADLAEEEKTGLRISVKQCLM